LLRTVTATRYVTPLREGGSLPAIVGADDLGTYVLKFRGAGQGRKALVAELVAAEIARHLDLLVPEVVLACLAPELGRSEPDPEIQDLLKRSTGLNLALDYLPAPWGCCLRASASGGSSRPAARWCSLLRSIRASPMTPRRP